MNEWPTDEDFREAEREALVEEVRLLRRLTPDEVLESYLATCRNVARFVGVRHPTARLLDDRERDAALDRLDRVVNGSPSAA